MPTLVQSATQSHRPVHVVPSSGLNDSRSDEEISPSELSHTRNWVPDRISQGRLIKRPGITQHQSSTNAVTSVFDGTAKDYYTDATRILDLSDGSALDTGLTSSTAPDWTSFNSLDIFVNGTEARETSNGTVWANVTNIPAVKFVQAYHRFLFGFGHDAMKIRWSDPEDEDTWDATNEWILSDDPSDTASGLCLHADKLVAFGSKSFYHLEGYLEKRIQVTYSNNNEGTTSHRSIVCAPDQGLFWWSKRGPVHSPDGFTIFYPGMKKIPKLLDRLNEAQYGKVHGIWNPNEECVEWWVCDGGSTTENMSIRYYPSLGVTQEEGQAVGSFWVSDGAGTEMGASGVVVSSLSHKIYVGSNAASKYVYEQTGATDDSTDITALLHTARLDVTGDSDEIKRLKEIVVRLTSEQKIESWLGIFWDNDLNFDAAQYYFDVSSGAFVLGTSKLDQEELAGSEPVDESAYPGERYRKIKLRFFDSTSFRTRLRGFILKGFVLSS